MKYIPDDELGQYVRGIRKRKPRHNPIREWLDAMEYRDTVFLPREEWEALKLTTKHPSEWINQSFRTVRSEKKFSAVSVNEGTGWLITRVK